VNVTEISDQLDAALGAILAAQAVLKKASGPLAITRSDILRKVDDRPRASADEVAWHLPLGVARSTLLAILRSPNSMAHPIQSIAFS
jgi:hypothetical protein